MSKQADWTQLEARPIRMVLLGGITVICVGIIGFLGTEVRQKLNELAYSPADNMQWTLSQFEVEFLELIVALDQATALPEDADPAEVTAALAELRKRYDILYSRLETLANSPLYRQAIYNSLVVDRFRRTSAEIRGLVPMIDSPDAELRADLPEIEDTLTGLRDTVRGILTQGNQVLVENADETRTDVALVLYRLVLASLVLLVALSLLVLIFRRMASLNERRAKQVLATSARLETIVSTSRDAILVLDRDGQIETANRAAEAMFDGTHAPLTGRWIGALLFRDTEHRLRPLTAEDLRVLCQAENRPALRLIGRTQAAVFPVEVSMNVTDREGAPVFVCVIRDISHQVEAELELKDSRDKALAGERAKARFLGVVSHEMRTPLNGIVGTIDLMEDAPDAELRDQYLPVLRNSAHVLLDLVNDVLEITRIEGQVPVQADPFDLDQVVASVIASEVPRARANGNRLERGAEPPVGTVRGDVRRVRTVLVNLVANAAKFTRDGEITVTAERMSDDMVEFQVIDTGIGIAEEDLPTIFDDFVRTDAAVNLQIQGTGLGLGIVRQLVQSMKGEIDVESIAGEGSLFRVLLPLPAAEAVQRGGPVPAAPPPDKGLPRLDILVVEDNPTNRFVTRRMLGNQGHGVTEAHDGLEAIRIAGERPFDLILMDVSMPNMDGIEAARRIRSGTGPNRATLIVALTAHIGEEVSASLDAAGLNEVLAKPLTRAALDAVVHRAAEGLARSRAEHATRAIAATDPMSLPIFDRAYTDTVAGYADPVRVGAQIARFLAEGDALFEDADADLLAMASPIHDFAGLAAVFGASRLHATLAAAEAAARVNDPDGLRTAMDQARAAWNETRRRVVAYRDREALNTGAPGE
ncbi:ATP-binding protein [Pseudooceanicola sp. LIPI14-2-Ac024]|uniref:hybrid sensor histidine kinase/response regulator n=1 Tax=Pseudooceanicola sp. LIPI14-2-Ac024 TaxID=3344875 RepID=UPI0035CF1708